MRLFRPGKPGASQRWAFMERFEVPNLDNPAETYLTRYRIVQTPWFALYVHRMDGPDSRATFHDHPWSFISIILKGGYRESFIAEPTADDWRHGPLGDKQQREAWNPARWQMRQWVRWSIHRIQATDAHYIRNLFAYPTWTLLLVGRRRHVWGYWDTDGWTPFDEHSHNDEFEAAMAARRQMKTSR